MAADETTNLPDSIDEDDLDEEPGEVIESAPPLKVGEERQIDSSGLKKLLLKRGVGWETPEFGDEVTVHYVGTLIDGTKFDSTRDKDKPLTFKLGKEQVVLGLQQGIYTMKKGELAKFIVPPQLGYGDLGANGVPQNCYIQFEVELISWITVVDICKDGGIIKRIMQKGENSSPPSDLDEVLVNYQVMLEDDLLAMKTPEGGVEFHLKDGHLCPALSKVIKTMRRGEKVNLVIQPQYAFGESGYDSKDRSVTVPPNCVLKIDLELISYKPVIDVTGDSKVLKKILEEGHGIDTAKENAFVSVRYIAMLENGTVFEKRGFDGEGPLEFITEEEQVIDGLDRAVATMKKGEKALLTINPEYGFGNVQVKRDLAIIPPNSTVIYEIEMVDFFKEKVPSELSCHERIQTAERKKEEGNLLFRDGKYQRAVKKYEKAVEFIIEDGSLSGDDGNAMKTIRVSCWLNVAACNLKLKDFHQVISLCSKVLDVEFYNIKALYRRAQAYMETYDLQLAEIDIKKALEADPQNREVKMVQKRLKELKAESNKRDAKLFANMFAPKTKEGYFVPRKKLKIGEVEE
ncbi:peptidyl-prolyl cis-trans isomerase FKBP62-like [Impatiens glandulifera]|uniref:peptidyl-prolyl cis-trans isomerase FKBP62-like n=1 Tax=Impatiens glandulifera TaxID=253017 RepID=UPI001FB10BA2|nr:peptidyl-prolyl cis-trans isomerase FKBP62-like [Impatiens glandulifera]